jgi:hypothetical protein
MTIARLLRACLAAGTTLGAGAAARWTLAAPTVTDQPARVAVPALRPAAPRSLVSVDSLARWIAGSDPFRADRHPSATAFEPSRAEGAPPLPPSRARPNIMVAGVLLGGTPAVILEGLPGTEGSRLLTVGDRVGEIVVRAITGDRVVVANADTSWTLFVRGRTP